MTNPLYRFDALDRHDAGLSMFTARQLEYVRPQVFEVKFAPRKSRILLPVNNQVDTGAEIYTYDVMERVGQAKFIRDFSKDFPTVDHKIGEVSTKIEAIGDSYKWNIQELRAAKYAKRRLSVRRATSARQTIEDTLDRIGLIGAPEMDMEGLFTLSGTLLYTIPVGGSGQKSWDTKTPDEIIEDAGAIIAYMITETLEIEKPDTVVMPTSLWTLLGRRRMGDGSNQLIRKFLIENWRDQGITRWESSPLLETAGVGGTRRMMAYKRDSEKLEFIIPQEFEQFPPQFDGLEVKTYCHARTSGVSLYYPKSVVYADEV